MKNCPFCNQPLEDEVTKCFFCDKPLMVAAAPKEKAKWYHSTGSLIVGFFVVGPFILPAVWTHPKYNKNTKIFITFVCLLATYFMGVAYVRALGSLTQYYQLEGQMLNGIF